MKKFICKILIFGCLIVFPLVLFVGITGEKVLGINGPNMEQQIKGSFEKSTAKKYNVMFFGNSRIYRGINPEKFGGEAFNFAHDNDTYNQIYYKLLYLKKKGSLPDTVVLGTDFFQFSIFSDTRNHEYGKYLDSEYLDDYDGSYGEILDTRMMFFQNNLKLGIKSFFKEKRENRPYQKENGQFIIPGGVNTPVDRDKTMMEIQVRYFKKIIEFLQEENIEYFLVMPPIKEEQMYNYSQEDKEKFQDFIVNNIKNPERYLYYGEDSRFSNEDFSDITHLNEAGADKFTSILWDNIKKVVEDNGED